MRRRDLGLLLAVPVLAVLVPVAQGRVDRTLGTYHATDESLYLWSGSHVRRLVPGLEDLTADIYWLRTVQYFGGQRVFALNKNFALLRPLIDIVTTLDPRMEIAYRYGAIFLCEPQPVGAGRAAEGIAVLEKGAANRPLDWRLRQDLGFFYSVFMNDPHKASEVLLEASKIPGAAYWLKTLAADILTKGGDRRTSRQIWRQMFEQGEGAIKENARHHLEVLDAMDVADALAARIGVFHQGQGRFPASLEELRAAGYLSGPAVDPSGAPFDYDPQTGRVSVSQRSTLWFPGMPPAAVPSPPS